MSTPYPPQPRRLMRDPSHKLVGGVCSGLAKYLNMDVNLVRILTVLISLFTGIPIVLYIIALFVLPEERPESQPPYVSGPQSNGYGAPYDAQNFAQPTYGQPTQPPADNVWGAAGAPWEQPQQAAPSAPTGSTSAPVHEQTWQQPTWQQPEAEPTLNDTAPGEPAAGPAAADVAAGSPASADAVVTAESADAVDTAESADAAESKRDS